MRSLLMVLSILLLLGIQNRAAVIYTDPPDEFLLTPHQPLERTIDLDGDGTDDFMLRVTTEDFTIVPLLSNRVITSLPYPPDVGTWVIPHDAGSIIGGSVMDGTTWSPRIDGPFGPIGGLLTACQLGGSGVQCLGYWPGRGAYAGLEFQLNGQFHYGWIYIDVGSNFNGGWLRDYAYESTVGANIVAGQIPESGMLVLCVVGTLLVARRRSRHLTRARS